MGSSNKVPICLAGYDASDIAWVVPVPGLTGLAITSRRSYNLMEPIGRLDLISASVSRLLRNLRLHADQAGWQLGEERQNLRSAQCLAHNNVSRCVDGVNLKNALGQIKAQGGNLQQMAPWLGLPDGEPPHLLTGSGNSRFNG